VLAVKTKDTLPASGAGERRRIKRDWGNGLKLRRKGCEQPGGWLGVRHFDGCCSHVAATGKMAGAAIIAGRLALVTRRLILIRGRLGMVRMLLYGRIAVRRALLRNSRMTIAVHRLHGDRNSQRIAAEKRQPDGQNHCNKFSGGAQHGRSLANSCGSVKYQHFPIKNKS